jgi:hypothetical protein
MTANEINRKNALLILGWCQKTFGLSPINGSCPKLVFHRKDNPWTAHYDVWKNEIHIFKTRHRTFMGLIGTIIHEYTHYHQSIKREYQQLYKIYNYKNHPLEREANRMEKKYKWMCYYETFSPNEAMKDI